MFPFKETLVSQPWTLDEALGDALSFTPTWRKPRKPKVFLPRAVRPGEPLEPLNSGRRHVILVMDSNGRGVEFVLGSTERGQNALWLHDFDRCAFISLDIAGV
ncbi:hypothetical protein NW767_001816 [Fusarium falciforme]|nr:hypothetical protein NW767_001816 [Fusarium falciforme]